MVDSRRYVLIVQPDRRLAATLTNLVAQEGLEVMAARDGHRALLLLDERGLPDLLVTELSLAGLDGFSLLAEFHRRAGLKRLPTLVVSAFPELRRAALQRRRELGISAVLASDSVVDKLRHAVHRSLHGIHHEQAAPAPTRARVRGEELRLAKIAELSLLEDQPGDRELQRLVEEAARAFEVPVAMISLVLRDHPWFKSHVGLSGPLLAARGALPEWTFCRHVVDSRQPLVVTNATLHPAFASNPLVRDGTVGSFAGAPLLTADDLVLGALCIADAVPRSFPASQVDELVVLARRVSGEIELRSPKHREAADAIGLAEQLAAERAYPGQPFPALAYLTAFLAHLPQGVLFVQPNRDVAYANPRAVEMLNLPSGQLAAIPLSQVVSQLCQRAADAADLEARMRVPASGPYLFTELVELVTPARQVLRWSSRPVHLGSATGQLALIEDVTREWELKEEREKQGRTDLLTGLGNRRNAEEAINREVARARRHGTPLSFILIDIDKFKRVNDTLGHAAGDAALRVLGEIFRRAFRGFDLASRWGGEEFLMVLPGEDLAHAAGAADRIRAQVEATLIPEVGRITISAGVSELRPEEPVEAAIARADRQLYVAKRQGRNRVAQDERSS